MRGIYHREIDDYEPTDDEIVEEILRRYCSVCGKPCDNEYKCGCGDYFFVCKDCTCNPLECANCKMMNEE